MKKEKEFSDNDIRVLIICNLALLVALAGAIWSNTVGGQNKEKLATSPLTNSPVTQAQNADSPKIGTAEKGLSREKEASAETDADIAKEVVVEIDDSGFRTKGFQAIKAEKLTVAISNIGSKPHSFAVKELDIDSGPIEPGQTKQISVELPDAATIYNFTSPVDEADDNFAGILMVIEK